MEKINHFCQDRLQPPSSPFSCSPSLFLFPLGPLLVPVSPKQGWLVPLPETLPMLPSSSSVLVFPPYSCKQVSARPPDSKHPCTSTCSCLSTVNQQAERLWRQEPLVLTPAVSLICSRTVSARSEQEIETTVGIINRKRVNKGN